MERPQISLFVPGHDVWLPAWGHTAEEAAGGRHQGGTADADPIAGENGFLEEKIAVRSNEASFLKYYAYCWIELRFFVPFQRAQGITFF